MIPKSGHRFSEKIMLKRCILIGSLFAPAAAIPFPDSSKPQHP